MMHTVCTALLICMQHGVANGKLGFQLMNPWHGLVGIKSPSVLPYQELLLYSCFEIRDTKLGNFEKVPAEESGVIPKNLWP